MQALATITTVFAFVAIAIHVYIWIIESFLWTKPKGRETFGMTEEFAESTKEMAANQGLYNLMLAWIAATGLLAFWFGSPQVGVALMFAGLGSMAIAGVYLFLTSPNKRKPALTPSEGSLGEEPRTASPMRVHQVRVDHTDRAHKRIGGHRTQEHTS